MSQDAQKALQKDWAAKLLGRYIAKEGDADERLAARDPKLQLTALPEDTQPVGEEVPWLFESDGKMLVKLSKLDVDAYRHIRPGRPITRDLRPGRLNVCSDDDGKITKVGFY
ncbi:hypothetical protein H4S02_013710 [Coemansia sp. RSA 2611]|nr:hypothetical protein H4S02_013710 [Coemansia sp. RSA 2611]